MRSKFLFLTVMASMMISFSITSVLWASTSSKNYKNKSALNQKKSDNLELSENQKKEAEASQPEERYEIIVTAPRIEIPLKKNPAATTVVETPLLRTMPRTIAVDEVMKLVPGVRVENQADGERVHLSIRGEGILTERGTRGIKTLVDGIPLNDPSGYVSDFFDVDWATVRRVEVLRGAAATFYGSSSTGGIINILTRNGGPEPVSGSANLVRGAYGLKKGLAEIGGTTGSLNYILTGSMLSGDGYRDWSAFRADNARSKFTFTLNPKMKVTAILGWTNFFNQNPEGLNLDWFSANPEVLRRRANPDAYTFNEYQKVKRVTSGLTSSIRLGENVDMLISSYYRHTRYKESVPASVIHRDFDTPGFTLQVNHKSGEGNIKNYFSAGLDLAWQAIDEFKHPNLGGAIEGPEFQSDQKMTQSGAGFFILERLELGPFWGLSASVRYDRITNKLTDYLKADGIDLSGRVAYKRMTGRLGLTWNPTSDFGLYASWGTGFLPPGTEELVNNPFSLGGYNPNLLSATSNGVELGARGSAGNSLVYDIALFHLATKNDFGRYRIATRPLETFYGNVGSTSRYGIETSIAWYPAYNLTVRCAYTYFDFKYKTVETLTGERYEKTRLPNIPQHQLYLDTEYQITKKLTAGFALEHVSSWYVDATNRIFANGYGRTDPYALAHVRLGYKFAFSGLPVELILAGRNIFNVLYYGFTEPDPDGNSYQPASTATWSISLKLGVK